MTDRVRHPRLFSAFRAALYLSAGLVVTLLSLAGVVALLAILVFAGVGLLTVGDVNLLAVGGLAGLVLALVALALGAVRFAVRHVERRVRSADSIPDPLDRVKGEYVADAIDERELERRLDGVLDPSDGRGANLSSGESSARNVPASPDGTDVGSGRRTDGRQKSRWLTESRR
ncbi:hypothetical protein ACFPYI_00210 [Halomarina salina]|uniref:Uncharacterized protein n=1 Tax=Halomarina salina TaxID=1872699 RepID=A0ABD5RH26_9EURY|nr:hypothetical protein [Halomarina salina]